jgi:opacity protein-like surface antigen
MKDKIVLCSCICIFLLSPAVFAAEGIYVSGSIGSSLLSDSDFREEDDGHTIKATVEFESGLTYGGAIGYDFGPGRVELAVDNRSHKLSQFADVSAGGIEYGDVSANGDINAVSAMISGFYDIQLNFPVAPYIGGGAGIAEISIYDKDDSELRYKHDTVFAYQVAAGITYDIDNESILEVGYRFFATPDPNFGKVKLEYYNHSFVVGLRFYLWP